MTNIPMSESPASPFALQLQRESLYDVAVAMRCDYQARGEKSQLDRAIASLREFLVGPNDNCADALDELGCCLRMRYEDYDMVEDAEESIQLHSAAMAMYPEGHPRHCTSLLHLATTLCHRGQKTNDIEPLEKAITLLQRIVSPTDAAHVDHDCALDVLGDCFGTKYFLTGDVHDFDCAMTMHTACLTLRPMGHPERDKTLFSLCLDLRYRYEHLGQLQDVHNAIQPLQEALSLISPANPRYFDTLWLLSTSMVMIADSMNSSSTLDEAVELHKTALSSYPIGHPNRPDAMITLALKLLEQFERHGKQDSLNTSIQLLREALLTYPLSRRQGVHVLLSSLAQALWMRHQHCGLSEDAEDAEYYTRRCFDWHQEINVPPSFRVASILYQSFRCGNSELALDNSICIFQRSLLENQKNRFRYCQRLLRLSEALLARFRLRKRLQDLEDAVTAAEAAVSVLQADSSSPRRYFDALRQHGLALLERCDHLGESGDLQKAEKSLLLAKSLTYDDDPRKTSILFELFRTKVTAASGVYDTHHALAFFSEALLQTSASPRIQLQKAIDALNSLKQHHFDDLSSEDQSLFVNIQQTVLSLMPRVALLGVTRREQVAAVQDWDDVAANACIYAVQMNQRERGVEMLEEGRAVFWTLAFRSRTAVDDIPAVYREELTDLVCAIDAASSVVSFSDVSKSVRELQIQNQKRRCDRMEEIVMAVRQTPGCERFLLPPTLSSLVRAASRGPVVMLLAGKLTCYALVLTPAGAVVDVPLQGVTTQKLTEWNDDLSIATAELSRGRRRRSQNTSCSWRHIYQNTAERVERVLQWLWIFVVKRILDVLQIKMAQGRRRPRLWWCPTGIFTFLPIHAAGLHGGIYSRGEACADYVVSSYTPTLNALVKGRNNFRSIRRAKLLAVVAAVPVAFHGDWPDLPGTEEEVRQIKEVLPQNMVISQEHTSVATPTASDVTIAMMEDSIPRANVLHLSCHGYQDADDPLSSGFVMRDGMLTIDHLMKLNLPNAFLAFLNACETAKGDHKQPDQVLHLAAAMLFTGFRSVVGTMWSIDEDDGLLVAAEFYKTLMSGDGENLEVDDVAYALDEAITKLRLQVGHPGRWSSHIHLGV